MTVTATLSYDTDLSNHPRIYTDRQIKLPQNIKSLQEDTAKLAVRLWAGRWCNAIYAPSLIRLRGDVDKTGDSAKMCLSEIYRKTFRSCEPSHNSIIPSVLCHIVIVVTVIIIMFVHVLGLTQELFFSRISESTTGYTFTPCVRSFTSPGIDTR